MSQSQLMILTIILVLLIIISGFFSAAETGLMSINRYRLRHKARMKKKASVLILKLLKRPDRLLGTILIGNNLSNIIASALATLIVLNLFGEKAVIVSTLILTIIILIFAEIAPKTFAALYPEATSKWVAWPIYILLKLFYPLVWMLNVVSNSLLYLFGFDIKRPLTEPLSREELRSIVYETTGRISVQYQNMLLAILDLNKMTVDDIMIPAHQIVGIDIEKSWPNIQKLLTKSEYDWLPVYQETMNKMVGVLHVRELMQQSLKDNVLNKEKLLAILHEPYFIPEGTPVNVQLMHFQRIRKRLALIVDEYGEVQGLITLADILEEIVGEFTTVTVSGKMIEKQTDGSFLVNGSMTIRELNRLTHWRLPTKEARTVNGLIIEHLEAIPRSGVCVLIADYPIEIIEVKTNRVKIARIFPKII